MARQKRFLLVRSFHSNGAAHDSLVEKRSEKECSVPQCYAKVSVQVGLAAFCDVHKYCTDNVFQKDLLITKS